MNTYFNWIISENKTKVEVDSAHSEIWIENSIKNYLTSFFLFSDESETQLNYTINEDLEEHRTRFSSERKLGWKPGKR